MRKTVLQHLATAIAARANCAKSGNDEWFDRHTESAETLVADFLAHGSGFDCGTKINLDKSNASRVVLLTSYHHMDDAGGYDGWTEHVVTVRPAFDGFELSISGRNRNDIKDYIASVFDSDLSHLVDHDADGFRRAA